MILCMLLCFVLFVLTVMLMCRIILFVCERHAFSCTCNFKFCSASCLPHLSPPPLSYLIFASQSPSPPGDLEDFDSLVFQSLHAIRTCHHDGITNDEEFAAEYGDKLSFVCTGSDGTEKELLTGGKAVDVTFSNRERYCDLVETFRCHEFDTQVRRRGDDMLF